MIHAIVFDFDGVIVDGVPLHDQAYLQTFQELGLSVPLEQLHTKIGKTSREVIAEILHEQGSDANQATAILRHSELLVQLYEQAPLAPHLEAFLQRVQANGIRMALASSTGSQILKSVVGRHHIANYFAGYVGGEMITKGKPDPEMIQKALNLLGCTPQDALAIDDAPSGIAAAKALQMKTIGYTFFSKKPLDEADAVVDDFLDIPYISG